MFVKLNNNPKIKSLNGTKKRLEYIESTGTQYINTGISFPNGFRVVTTITRTNTDSSYSQFIGSHGGSQNHNCARIAFNKWESCGGQTVRSGGSVAKDTVYNIDISNANNKAIIKVNGSTLVDSTLTGSYTNLNVWLFNVNGNTSYPFKGRLGKTKIYDSNDVLRLDLTPCKDSDNVVCMYDEISGNFFYNQGTGNFTAGPSSASITYDVCNEIQELFIKDCPLFDSYTNLKKIYEIQSNNNNLVLSRIRIDIGNISSSLSELLQYTSLAGFNDNCEYQTKPRLVGTWTINNWYNTAELVEAQLTFDGLTIISNSEISYEVVEQNIIHILSTSVPSINPSFITSSITKIYIGAGISSNDDNTLKNSFASNNMWSSYSSILDTWYNYLHPTT